MMTDHIVLAGMVLLHAIALCYASNVLFVSVYGSNSHVIALSAAMEALSARGHNVTFLTFMKPHFDKPNNVTVLVMHRIVQLIANNKPDHFAILEGNLTAKTNYYNFATEKLCKELLNDASFQLVANDSTTEYGAIIMDVNCHECALVLVWLLKSPPLIFFSAFSIRTYQALNLGLPSPFSHVPLFINPFTDRMSIVQRFVNALLTVTEWELSNLFLIPKFEEIVRAKYENFPSILGIESNFSFLFLNTHSLSVDFSRPLAPFVAEVSGTQCRPARKLPKYVEDFIEGSGSHGFVYFSFGTYVSAAKMKETKLNAFIVAFKRLEQRVIWKYESDITNLPRNVLLVKQVDQQNILGHHKLKAFITQGGQLSIQEALYHGVPMVILPIYADQHSNMANLAEKGLATTLNYLDITEECIFKALQQVIYNPSYREKCHYYSQLIKDNALSSIDKIVYWVEYVIRHKGAHHLQFNNSHLHWTQYYLLDVMCLTLVVMFIVKKIILLFLEFAL